jgi:hypothetical protein
MSARWLRDNEHERRAMQRRMGNDWPVLGAGLVWRRDE